MFKDGKSDSPDGSMPDISTACPVWDGTGHTNQRIWLWRRDQADIYVISGGRTLAGLGRIYGLYGSALANNRKMVRTHLIEAMRRAGIVPLVRQNGVMVLNTFYGRAASEGEWSSDHGGKESSRGKFAGTMLSLSREQRKQVLEMLVDEDDGVDDV